MGCMDKPTLFAALRTRLEARLADLEAAGGAARAGTRVDGDHRPSNRGERAAVTSQGYLAHGLAQRAEGLREALDLLDRVPPTPRDKVVTGAVVTLEDEDGAVRRVLVFPGGEGVTLPDDIAVVSPRAPLVRDIQAEGVGAVAVVVRAGRELEVEVINIS